MKKEFFDDWAIWLQTSKKGKGQNVKNHFIESQKKNIESQKVDWLIRTSKVFFEIDQNVERSERQKFEKDQNVESQIRLLTFWFYLWRQKKSERQKSKRATTYGVLPMCSKACGGLG